MHPGLNEAGEDFFKRLRRRPYPHPRLAAQLPAAKSTTSSRQYRGAGTCFVRCPENVPRDGVTSDINTSSTSTTATICTRTSGGSARTSRSSATSCGQHGPDGNRAEENPDCIPGTTSSRCAGEGDGLPRQARRELSRRARPALLHAAFAWASTEARKIIKKRSVASASSTSRDSSQKEFCTEGKRLRRVPLRPDLRGHVLDGQDLTTSASSRHLRGPHGRDREVLGPQPSPDSCRGSSRAARRSMTEQAVDRAAVTRDGASPVDRWRGSSSSTRARPRRRLHRLPVLRQSRAARLCRAGGAGGRGRLGSRRVRVADSGRHRRARGDGFSASTTTSSSPRCERPVRCRGPRRAGVPAHRSGASGTRELIAALRNGSAPVLLARGCYIGGQHYAITTRIVSRRVSRARPILKYRGRYFAGPGSLSPGSGCARRAARREWAAGRPARARCYSSTAIDVASFDPLLARCFGDGRAEHVGVGPGPALRDEHRMPHRCYFARATRGGEARAKALPADPLAGSSHWAYTAADVFGARKLVVLDEMVNVRTDFEALLRMLNELTSPTTSRTAARRPPESRGDRAHEGAHGMLSMSPRARRRPISTGHRQGATATGHPARCGMCRELDVPLRATHHRFPWRLRRTSQPPSDGVGDCTIATACGRRLQFADSPSSARRCTTSAPRSGSSRRRVWIDGRRRCPAWSCFDPPGCPRGTSEGAGGVDMNWRPGRRASSS